MKDTILDLLKALRPENDFTQSNDFVREGLLDSMDIVALVDSVEEEYGITIPGAEISLKNFSNLDAIIQLVERLKTQEHENNL